MREGCMNRLVGAAMISTVVFVAGCQRLVDRVESFFRAPDAGNGFPLPSGMSASGQIVAAGLAVENEVVLMSVLFSELNVAGGTFSVLDISTFAAMRHTDIMTGQSELLVVYEDMDINSGSDTLLTVAMSAGQIAAEVAKYENMLDFSESMVLEQNAWIIKVGDNGTATDPADDLYTINGGGQYVELNGSDVEIVQLTMIETTMTTQCRKNPGGGYAFFQNTGAGAGGAEIGHAFLNFHPACDGNADITVATGVYVTSIGKTTALQLER